MRQVKGKVSFGIHVVAEDQQGSTRRPEAGRAKLRPV